MLLRCALPILGALSLLACGAKTAPYVEELPPCESDAECDDGVFCDGMEQCIEGRCRRGAPPDCADMDPCTEDLCVEETRSCENPPVFVADDDRDGYFVLGLCGDDCDDHDPLVYPGADEVCNGKDDDCDLRIDEGAAYMAEPGDMRLTFSDAASGRGDAAWSPLTETWGVTYWDYTGSTSDVYFQQLAPNGTPVAEPELLTLAPGDAWGADIVWNEEESQYAIVWQDRRDGVWEIYFNRLTAEGGKLAPDYRVTFVPHWSINPTLVWTGNEYMIAWQDWRHELVAPDNFEIYVTFMDREGFEIGDDIRVTFDPDNSEAPELALADGEIGIAFVDGRTGVEQVWFLVVSLTGEVVVPAMRVSTSTTDAYAPELVWASDGYLLVWQEQTESGDFDIMGARIARPSNAIEGPFAVAGGEPWARRPRILDNGTELLIGYSDDRRGVYDMYAAVYDTRFMRLSEDIAVTRGPRDSVYGTLARGATSVGVLFEDQRDGNWEVYFTRLLCADPVLEP